MASQRFTAALSALSVLAFMALPGAAQAAPDIVVVQPLGFGSFMLSNNNAAHTLVVPPQGAPVYAPAIHQTAPAQRGEYSLEGLDPDVDVSLSVNPPIVTLTCVCGGPSFSIDNFTFFPATPHTDPAGNTIVYLGARLRTDASHTYYLEGAFEGDMQLVVNY